MDAAETDVQDRTENLPVLHLESSYPDSFNHTTDYADQTDTESYSELCCGAVMPAKQPQEKSQEKPQEKPCGPCASTVLEKETSGASGANEQKAELQYTLTFLACLVCGASSSGFHFGVMTCDSCKMFFRRSLTQKPDYFCHRNEKCVITPEKRSNCSSCRLKRCLELGMSKAGVRRGRHTFAQLRAYEQKVNQLQSDARCKQEEEEEEKRMRRRRIKDTVERLRDLHLKHQMLTPEILEKVKQRQAQEKAKKQAAREALGPLSDLSLDEMWEYYRTTGIDLSGFVSLQKPCTRYCSDKWAFAFLDYLKSLNEFMELSLPDRITTLKGAFRIWKLVTAHQVYSIEDQVGSCIHCGACYFDDHFQLFLTEDEHSYNFKPLAMLRGLNLTMEETAVLRAFVIFDTSQNTEELEEPAKVTMAQDFLLECLLYVLEQNQGAETTFKIYSKIIHILTETRTLFERVRTMNDKLLTLEPEIKYSRIAGEVYSVQDCYIDDLGNELNNLQL